VEKPKLKRDWIGRRVLTLQELRNGWGIIPAGVRMLVTDNRRASTRTPGSLVLTSETRCECCGLKATISGVREADVQLLPDAA
jgi:hypothetical protein